MTSKSTWRIWCFCRACQPCPSVCTREKQPCINRTPTDTIFSEGNAFQRLCWWMTTGWRCDFEAPNVLSPTTCACQCVSSLTLGGVGGSYNLPLPRSTVFSHAITIGETDRQQLGTSSLFMGMWLQKGIQILVYTSLYLHQYVNFICVRLKQKRKAAAAAAASGSYMYDDMYSMGFSFRVE